MGAAASRPGRSDRPDRIGPAAVQCRPGVAHRQRARRLVPGPGTPDGHRHRPDGPIVEAAGEPAGDVAWRVGRDRENWPRRRASIALAHDPVTTVPGLRVDLGPGDVRAMAGTPTHLWLVVDTPRPVSSYLPPAPAAVVRLDARTGALETLLPPASLDITPRCWPLPSRPPDPTAYEGHWRTVLVDDGLTADGTRIPPHRQAVLVGRWPDSEVHLLFTSYRHPGLRLRRKVRLYDELGRAVSPDYASHHLDEALASGAEPYRTDDSGVFDI